MATLETVGQYVGEARVLLQDTRVPYRYSDVELMSALSIGMQEAYRVRSDLFLDDLSFDVPSFANSTDKVPIEIGYRQSFVYYMVGRAQLRDQEDTTDQRAGALIQKFVAQLLTTTS